MTSARTVPDSTDTTGSAAATPAPGPVVTERDVWHGRELDLDAYLERVGLAGAQERAVVEERLRESSQG
ncbi:hypothetical protein BJF83_02825 [Nocardiopsis sp. CNR-923]|uniref:hypothetical protein n=1 Tax=Nocardiopsis sp. CNR-923 TaxID=1904965 RepID=UPI0009674AE1|nr:hypothetical protein BJF83_02825 [Nocardiopsis sp. CNR-923]